MTKNTWLIVLIGLALVGGITLLAKHDVTPTPEDEQGIVATSTQPVVSNVLPYGKVTLHVGETAQFKNNSVTLLRVKDESRCAEGVTCIWAGTVKAEILSVTGMGTSTETIELGKSLTTEAEKITFVSATPYPKQGSQITQSQYALTFDVSLRTPAATAPQGACYVGGCSGEVCSDQPNVVSTCMYREVFACYKTAKCERQANGSCGWTETSALKACVAASAN